MWTTYKSGSHWNKLAFVIAREKAYSSLHHRYTKMKRRSGYIIVGIGVVLTAI